MAVIRFNPTWIATRRASPESYDYDFPLRASQGYRAYVAFDTEEIGRVLSLFNVTSKNLIAELDVSSTFDRVDLVLHSSTEPPSETNHIITVPTSAPASYNLDGDNIIINLDQSLVVAGPTSPVPVTFHEAINKGFVGFEITTWIQNGFFLANDLFIELKGDFDNPRPTPTSPTGGVTLNLNEVIRFSWVHNSPLNQVDFEFRYRVKGTSSWTTVKVDSNNRYYDLPANTLTPNEYEWQVRTTSEYGFVSPWSLVQVFNAAITTPTPVFVKPIQNSVIEISDLYVEWESIDQYQYEFELLDAQNNLIWSDARISSSKELTIENILENNRTYKLRLRVNQSGNFFSPWVQITITVSYTEPAKATLTITPDDPFLEIDIHNPVPTGTQPNALSNDLFRRKKGSSNWVRIAKALIPNSKYYDYAVANKTEYEYRVTTFGGNDTTSTSNTYSGVLTFKFDVISLANEPSNFVKLFLNPQRSFSKNFNAVKKHFSGRKLPTVEFGEVVDSDSSLSYLVSETDYIKLDEIVSRQETLLYRDIRGRKQYITINTLTTTDDIKYRDFYIVDLSISQVDFDEAVT